MSRIDFIVHQDLYNYGLQFSYEWANEYWITYFASYAYFSVVIGFIYLLASNRTRKDLKVSAGLSATVSMLQMGGLSDILFFSLWSKGLPSDNVTWWWMPWYHIFGVWTSSMQIALLTLMFVVTVFMWIQLTSFPRLVAKQLAPKTIEKDFNEIADM